MGAAQQDLSRARLSVTLLPAGQGDSVLIEYGDAQRLRRILVDGGPVRSYQGISGQLSKIGPDLRSFDLLVMTHVDADHIEGIIKLVNDADLSVEIGEVWFNGYQQLPPDDTLGPAQGEILSAHHATSANGPGSALAGRSEALRRGRAGRFAAAARAVISSAVNPAHTPAAGRERSA